MKELKQDKSYGKIFLQTNDDSKKIDFHLRVYIGNYRKFIERDEVLYVPLTSYTHKSTEYDNGVISAYNDLKARNLIIHCNKHEDDAVTFAVVLLKTCGYTYSEARAIVEDAGFSIKDPAKMQFAKEYKNRIKILKEKSCYNCEYGSAIPGYPAECNYARNGKWTYEERFCPEELICEYWKMDEYHGMEDKYEMWKYAVTITVD